jgi:hypothetical protein
MRYLVGMSLYEGRASYGAHNIVTADGLGRLPAALIDPTRRNTFATSVATMRHSPVSHIDVSGRPTSCLPFSEAR